MNYIGPSGTEVLQTIGVYPWQPLSFTYPPYSMINPSNIPGYMFTLGSGSLYIPDPHSDIRNVSGIDVFRLEFNPKPNEGSVNVDHYIAKSLAGNVFSIYQTAPQTYHWLKPTDEIIRHIPHKWRYCIKAVLDHRISSSCPVTLH